LLVNSPASQRFANRLDYVILHIPNNNSVGDAKLKQKEKRNVKHKTKTEIPSTDKDIHSRSH